MRDKIITAITRTLNGVEWTSLRIKQDEVELVEQKSILTPSTEECETKSFASVDFPEESESLRGDITVAIRTANLLTRIMPLPSSDPSEIADMVEFQIDKVSPFPSDQLAISHEILQQDESSSSVLMVAAKRSNIDQIGDAFQDKGIHIHSMDARVLGWLHLLKEADQIKDAPCEILIIDDGIDFSLVILEHGIPLAIRMLHTQNDDETIIAELTHEIAYTLTAIDVEREIPLPSAIHFWSHERLSSSLKTALESATKTKVTAHELSTLPPLSEGIVRRTLHNESRIELIPQEWIDYQNNQHLQKKFIRYSAFILATWLIIMTGLFITYKTRDIQLNKVTKQNEAIKPEALKAKQNRQKLRELKAYTDRSGSALECLREASRLLPPDDIEFTSYNYNKKKGIKLIGTAINDDIVDNYFSALANSSLFEQLKDQSVRDKTYKNERRAVFSVSLDLPATEEK